MIGRALISKRTPQNYPLKGMSNSTPLVQQRQSGGVPLKANEQHKASEYQSVFNLINSCLGAGLLGFPFCFKECGVVLAMLLLLVVWLASWVSLQMLLQCGVSVNKSTYEAVARDTLGNVGLAVTRMATIGLNLGSIMAYTNIMTDVLSSVGGTIIPAAAEPSREILMTGVGLFCILPIGLFIRNTQAVSQMSRYSCLIIFTFCASLALMAIAQGPLLALPTPPATTPSPSHLPSIFNPDGIPVAFPIMLFAFAPHAVVFPVYNTLASQTPRGMQRVLLRATLICVVVYALVGVSGYGLYGSKTLGDVMRNMGGGVNNMWVLRAVYERVLKVAYGLSVLATIPWLLIPMHRIVLQVWHGLSEAQVVEPQPGIVRQMQVVDGVMCCLSLLLALTIPNVEFIFGLVGSTASLTLALVLPSLMTLSLYYNQGGGGGGRRGR